MFERLLAESFEAGGAKAMELALTFMTGLVDVAVVPVAGAVVVAVGWNAVAYGVKVGAATFCC